MAVLEKRPLVDTDKHSISQYTDLKELSFKPDTLPSVVRATSLHKRPSSLPFVLPGSNTSPKALAAQFTLQHGASAISTIFTSSGKSSHKSSCIEHKIFENKGSM